MDSLGTDAAGDEAFRAAAGRDDVLIGRARTGLYMPMYTVTPGDNPYEVEIALVDDLKPGEVPVLACSGPTDRIAPWGELLSTASQARGAAGLRHRRAGARRQADPRDGLSGVPRRHRSARYERPRRMMERDIPVECAGVRVRSGDIVFGDADGVVVIPRSEPPK